MPPKNRAPTTPGEVLEKEFLAPTKMTQGELAKRMGTTIQTVNQIIRGKRSVTAATALRLARVFDTTPQFWLNLQNAVDLWKAREEMESAAHA